jgi:hypothetical protein
MAGDRLWTLVSTEWAKNHPSKMRIFAVFFPVTENSRQSKVRAGRRPPPPDLQVLYLSFGHQLLQPGFFALEFPQALASSGSKPQYSLLQCKLG